MFLAEQQPIFLDRADAGCKLAKKLHAYAGRKDVVVLGIPRGGVLVAFEVAAALHLPLDLFVSRKLGVPGQEELAFGAVSNGGVRVLDPAIVEVVGISQEQIEEITQTARKELERREILYRGARPPLTIEAETVLLVDDGMATGSSIRAAIRALRQRKPARLVVAVPVAPESTCNLLRNEVDELVSFETPQSLSAIGQFYQDFSQVADEEVTQLLRLAPDHASQIVQEQNPSAAQGSAVTTEGRKSPEDGRTC